MKKYLASQFGNPRGAVGHLAGHIMARRNVERNRWVVDLLGLEPDHNVLEIGFGPGLAIQAASNRIVAGKILGIDHSKVMLRQATRRNIDAIRAGKVKLVRCSIDDMDLKGRTFDRAFAINATMFWHEPVEQIRRIRDFLKPRGRLAIAIQPRWTTSLETVAEKIRVDLEQAGLSNIEKAVEDFDPVGCACVVGSV